jgi:hypothetical protein
MIMANFMPHQPTGIITCIIACVFRPRTCNLCLSWDEMYSILYIIDYRHDHITIYIIMIIFIMHIFIVNRAAVPPPGHDDTMMI